MSDTSVTIVRHTHSCSLFIIFVWLIVLSVLLTNVRNEAGENTQTVEWLMQQLFGVALDLSSQ